MDVSNMWDPELEWKLRHVRTPEGARYYGKPIGSPITAADRATARRRATGGTSGGGRASGSETTGSRSSGAREGAANPRPTGGAASKPAGAREGAKTPKRTATPKPVGDREGARKPRPARVPGLAAADGPQNRERRSTPVTPDTATARPQLYTYQRKNIVKLGLDQSTDNDVREAALRVEERRPITQAQSDALAKALRAQANAAGTKPVQRRSMLRSADTFDAASHRARGESFEPAPVAGVKPSKTSIADTGEGDTVIIPDGDGGTRIGKVASNEPIMGGKLHKVAVVGDDGVLSFHLVDPKATSYLLPDRPEPEPVDTTPEVPDLVAAKLAREAELREREVELHSAVEAIREAENSHRRQMADVAIDYASRTALTPQENADAIASVIEVISEGRRPQDGLHALRVGSQFTGRNFFQTEDRVVTPFLNAMQGVREQAAKDMIEAVRNFRPANGEDPHAGLVEYLGKIRDNPNAPARTGVAASLADILRDAETDIEPVDSNDPDVPQSGSLSERMDAYRTALGPSYEIGRAKVSGATYDQEVTLEQLEAGDIPEPTRTEFTRIDRVADGGPGATAMRQLEIIRAAGRELDEEVSRRISEADPTLSGDQSADYKKHQDEYHKKTAEWAEFSSARDDDVVAHREKYKEALSEEDRALWDSAPRLSQWTGEAPRNGPPEQKKVFARYRRERKKIETRDQDKLDAIATEARQAHFRSQELEGKYAAARQKAALAVLGSVREMGGHEVKFNADDLAEVNGLADSFKYAQQFYPKSWLEAMDKRGKVGGDGYSVRYAERGFYRDLNREISVSHPSYNSARITPRAADKVTIHEVGHAMESAIPALVSMEEAYLWARTSTGEIGMRERSGETLLVDDQMTYRDEFKNRYTGKTYPTINGQPYAFEVFTTNVESLFGGSYYMDDDSRRWTLGVMALLG